MYINVIYYFFLSQHSQLFNNKSKLLLIENVNELFKFGMLNLYFITSVNSDMNNKIINWSYFDG